MPSFIRPTYKIVMEEFSSWRPCLGCFHSSRRCSPTADIKDRNLRKRLQKFCRISTLKSSNAPIGSAALWSCPNAGSSSAPSHGSIAADGSPRIGRTSTERRSRSCASHQSASCSENSAIRPEVSGQTLRQDSTLIAVIEMSLSSWLVAGIVPGVERQPLKKLAVDESALLKLLNRWREEAEKAGRRIERITVAFEAGRDGFWLARWLRARGIEAHVIHASSVAVSREHRRAKTDRLDTELLKRAFLGWLRGERDHCKMVTIPSIKEEDAKRPNRERESLVGEQTRIVNRMKAALVRLGIRGF